MYPKTFELTGDDAPPSLSEAPAEDAKTAPETADAERAWFMNIALRCRPRCFGCGGRMLPKAVRIVANYAVCEVCSNIDYSEIRPTWAALESLGSPLELTRSRGIIFWTPPSTLPDIEAYMRWMELWDIMARHSSRALLTHHNHELPALLPPHIHSDLEPSNSAAPGC